MLASAHQGRGLVGGSEREQAVAVDQHGHRRAGHHALHGGDGGRRPPQARPDDEGAEAPEVGQHGVGPSLRRQGEPGDLRGRQRGRVDPRAAESRVPRAGPQRRTRAQRGGPRHAGRAGDDPHGALPLVRVARSGRHPDDESEYGHHSWRYAGGGRRHAPVARRYQHQRGDQPPGRHAAEPHRQQPRRVGPHRVVGRLTREAVEARGDVDGQHGRAERIGRAVLAVEARAERGVDHEIAGRHLTRVGRGVEQLDPYATATQPGGRGAAVGAVVALAGHDRHAAAVRAAEQVERPPRHRRPGPLDQGFDGLGRGRVDSLHLLRREDGYHVAAAHTAEGGRFGCH